MNDLLREAYFFLETSTRTFSQEIFDKNVRKLVKFSAKTGKFPWHEFSQEEKEEYFMKFPDLGKYEIKHGIGIGADSLAVALDDGTVFKIGKGMPPGLKKKTDRVFSGKATKHDMPVYYSDEISSRQGRLIPWDNWIEILYHHDAKISGSLDDLGDFVWEVFVETFLKYEKTRMLLMARRISKETIKKFITSRVKIKKDWVGKVLDRMIDAYIHEIKQGNRDLHPGNLGLRLDKDYLPVFMFYDF